MRTVTTALCLAAFLAGSAVAAERQSTRGLSCSAIKALVTRDGEVVLASSETAYETVLADGGACQNGDSGSPAYVPSADEANCFAGWRCTQRSSDGSSSR